MSDPRFTADTILEKTGYSRGVMARKLKGLLGTGLEEYLLKIRIGIVKDKLTNTDDELESIARMAGFTDVESMSRAFQRETGKTVYSVRE